MYLLAFLSLLLIPSDFDEPSWPPAPLGASSSELSESSRVSDDNDEHTLSAKLPALSNSAGVPKLKGEQVFSYDYIEFGLSMVKGLESDDPVVELNDAANFSLNLSLSLQEYIYMRGSIGLQPSQEAVIIDGIGEDYPAVAAYGFGVGAHFPLISGSTDIFAETFLAGISTERLDGDGYEAENGYGANFGVRQKLGANIELQVLRSSLDIDGSTRVQHTAKAIVNLDERQSVVIGVTGEDFDFDSAISVGFRFSF